MLDVARAHQCSIVRRGHWEFLETPELKKAKQEIRRLNGALDILSKPFPGHETLTPKERVALAQIIRGASSKEAARTLGISPRTVDFHRANLLKKLGARNAADLVHKVLGECRTPLVRFQSVSFFFPEKLDWPVFSRSAQCPASSPAPAHSAGSPHGENHSSSGYDREHADYLSPERQAAQPKRAGIVDGRQRTHCGGMQ